MPVITIRALPPRDPQAVERMLAALPAALAEASGVQQQRIWALFQPLAPGAMVLGGRVIHSAADQPVAVVDVQLRERPPWVIQSLLEATARGVAQGLELPLEDVWARANIVQPGMVFAGGEILS